jgi:CelD/BcsL family acetyltransferase involved in cellulose biosynthesis
MQTPMQQSIPDAPQFERSASTAAWDAPRLSIAPRAPEPFAAPVARSTRAFARVLAEWQDLAAEAPPLFAPELSLLAARVTGAREATLFGARQQGRLVAALPLERQGRTLLALRCEHSPRVDLVGDAAALPSLWHAIRRTGGWDVLELKAVPADSPLAVALPQLARDDGFAAYVRETHQVPWFLVDEIEQRIHRRFRGDMRRLERQLGGVQLERITRFDREALRDVLRLEAAAWKGAAGTAITCDERLVRFYAALSRVFARRQRLTLAFLRAQGKRIAAQLSLEDATTFYLLKTGYDPEYAHFGPGQLLVRETALDAGRRGLARYDLLGRATAWKMKWTDETRPHVSVTIYAPSPGGHARRFAREIARPFAGRVRRALRPGQARAD